MTIEGEYESFHLIVDGYDCRQGMPEWIEYLGDLTFRFNNIQADHEIEVVVDGSPEPPVDTYTLTFTDAKNGHWALPIVTNIDAGESCSNEFTVDGEYETTHLIIDDIEYLVLPEWVELHDNTYIFNNITANHTIQLVVVIGPGPEPKPFDDLIQDGTYLIGFNQNPILPSDIMELLDTTDAVHQFDYDEKSGRELITIFGVCTMDNRPIIGYMKESVNSRNKVKNYFTMVNQETLAIYNKDVATPLEYTHDGWIEAWYEIDENTGEIVNGWISYLKNMDDLILRVDNIKVPAGQGYDISKYAWMIDSVQRLDNK